LRATAAPVADEPEHAPAALLLERDAPVAVVALVADVARAQHADGSPDLLVLRLDEEEPLKNAVLADRQDHGRVAHGPRHPAAPGAGEGGGLDRAGLGAGTPAQKNREQHDGAHGDAARVYQARRSLTDAAHSTMRLTPKTHTIVAPVGKSSQ